MGKEEIRRKRPEKRTKDSLFRELAQSQYSQKVVRSRRKYDRNQCRQTDWLTDTDNV